MSKKSKPIKLDRNKRYFHLRSEYFQIMHDASVAYEKTIITLSTATLGVSFTLLMYNHNKVEYSSIIFLSSVFFIIAIIACLRSFWCHQEYGVDAVKKLNLELDDESQIIVNPCDKELKRAQIIAGISFVAGMILIIVFVFLNIYKICQI